MAVPLIATYRLQLNASFTLDDARARVPYLEALGVSHLYCSPVLAARAGSTHGYDVADPTHVSDVPGGMPRSRGKRVAANRSLHIREFFRNFRWLYCTEIDCAEGTSVEQWRTGGRIRRSHALLRFSVRGIHVA